MAAILVLVLTWQNNRLRARQPLGLMSLLPPIHVALVEEDTIRDSFAEVVREQGWAGRMPTNVVLVSGPSKTADIEQTLAFGVHGPKELIVMVLKRSGGVRPISG